MNKKDFIKLFCQTITVMGNLGQFWKDDKLIIKERQVTLEKVGNYYCPWYYNSETGQGYVKTPFEEILGYSPARAVVVKDVERKIRFPSKRTKIKQYIQDFQGKTEKSLRPFPVVTDRMFNKSLVLDGNHTLVALYQSWDRGKQIPVAEVCGGDLIRIFPDFCIVYRS